jgi:hypothetical protein
MICDIDMFCFRRISWVAGKLNCSIVVTKNFDSLLLSTSTSCRSQLTETASLLFKSVAQRLVLSLRSEQCSCRLSFAAPADLTIVVVKNVSSCLTEMV